MSRYRAKAMCLKKPKRLTIWKAPPMSFFLNTNQDPVLMHHKSILFFSLLAILEGLFVLMHNETAHIPSHFKIEFVTLASQQNQNNQEWGR
jgi:hypothetical protein